MQTHPIVLLVLTAIAANVVACAVSTNGPTCGRRLLIVGSGIAGAATASFLAERHDPSQLCIDVSEEASHVGGRVTAAQLPGGATVELGASVFHDVNRYMMGFAAARGANLTHPYLSAKIAVLGARNDGNTDGAVEVVFTESPWRPASIARALWRYGLSPLHMERCVDALVAQLDAVYALQRRNVTFASAEQLLEALGLRDYTRPRTRTVRAFAAECGASDLFIDEIVHSMTRINYGQGTDISALAGSVAMKGKGDEVHSAAGGNAKLIAAILDASGARTHLRRRVKLRPADDASSSSSSFALELTDLEAGEAVDGAAYDAVVFARPLDAMEAAAVGLSPVPMHATHVAVVQGNLSLAAYGLADLPGAATIFTTAASARGRVPFRSIGLLRNVNPPAYKIFSDEPLGQAELAALFPGERATLAATSWHAAYPKLQPGEGHGEAVHPFRIGSTDAVGFRPRQRLYHAGALEYAVSTMETQCIAAANTALLVSSDLFPDARNDREDDAGAVTEDL